MNWFRISVGTIKKKYKKKTMVKNKFSLRRNVSKRQKPKYDWSSTRAAWILFWVAIWTTRIITTGRTAVVAKGRATALLGNVFYGRGREKHTRPKDVFMMSSGTIMRTYLLVDRLLMATYRPRRVTRWHCTAAMVVWYWVKAL